MQLHATFTWPTKDIGNADHTGAIICLSETPGINDLQVNQNMLNSYKLIILTKKMIGKFKPYSLLAVLIMIGISGCSSLPGKKIDEEVVPIMADREMQDKELLDISIKIFAPGKLPEDKSKKRGLSEKIRLAESRYIPIHLKYTLQKTGYWGNVQVVPDENIGTDLLVKGKIEHSDGESIALNIQVYDAINRLWFNKTYKEVATRQEHDKTEPEKEDVFQDLFNEISNDLIRHRNKLDAEEIQQIQKTADLRFASEMAPDTFKSYLYQDKNGDYQIIRLPAVDDPMVNRLQLIQARHEMLVDTVNGYYDGYYTNLWESYANWRKFRSEELQAIREIERKALTQKVLGAAAIIGAIALGASNNSDVRYQTSALRGVMVAGGAYALYSGIQTSKEANINKEAIEELGESFELDAEPLVLEVQGETVRLTGSAEEQYAKWRKILKDIYSKEIGY